MLSPSELIIAIQQQNKELLTRADGIGPKVASRLLTELKSFVGKQSFDFGGQPVTSSLNSDAIDTLVQLGYRQNDATNIVRKILAEAPSLSTQEIIPKALGIYRGRDQIKQSFVRISITKPATIPLPTEAATHPQVRINGIGMYIYVPICTSRTSPITPKVACGQSTLDSANFAYMKYIEAENAN